ncbi:MAG: hypothetical protein K1Y02_05520 [Candidatus Hydrogenedentes bacterium]|nr:hypothetical protein [Candidatus Hydrogenedentota bacterium]
MKPILILAACAILGAGLDFKENIIYRLELKSSAEPVYGYYKSEASTPKGKVYYFKMVSPDSNATLPPGSYQESEIADRFEVSDDEWKQLQEQAQARAGNVKVQTSSGEIWVNAHEFELAKRATQMAEERLKRSKPTEITESTESEPVVLTEPAPSPGFLKLWGGHIALAAGVVLLIGAVVKFMILGASGRG